MDEIRDSDFKRFGNLYYLVGKYAGPLTYTFRGVEYLRYMDRIYLPDRPSQLEEKDVEDLASLRIELGPEVINYERTQRVLSELYTKIKTKLNRVPARLLDFGCGDGNIISMLIAEQDSLKEVAGIDICEDAIALAKLKFSKYKDGWVEKVTWDRRFNIKTGDFCAIIANFVMHFPVSDLQINELYRILKSGGVFVYNDYLYKRDKTHFQRTKEKLENAGFRTVNEVNPFYDSRGSEVYTTKQMIVIGTKP